MEDNLNDEKQPDIACKVCGEKRFNLREGYYYCVECGTKQDQVRAIEVAAKDDFKDPHIKKQKIKTIKTENAQLTSWECYNYILRGLVEELLGYGAKDELKLMSLQVWAAYLRHNEVAFFNKKQPELPKLGYRYYKRDLKTLYNHVQEKRTRKRKRDESVSTNREWRRNKRQLDESVYSANQSLNSTEMSQSMSSVYTSSTGTTGRPIQLKFSAKARKRLKKMLPAKHIKAHEMDSQSVLTCHKLKATWKSVPRKKMEVDSLNIKQLYTVLAIALNLIEDDIQISDLLRFIDEGHLGTRNVLKYFPEKLSDRGDELFAEIENNLTRDRCSDKSLRDQITFIAESINLSDFRKPDIFKLCLRYITDLNLPKEFGTYIERLINIHPPQMQVRASFALPQYEARAMAYIVFVLKLLFGLDGEKEVKISEASMKINARLRECNEYSMRPAKELFVWSEWVEFVEMRKVIVGQYHKSFARQFKQSLSTAQIFEELVQAQRGDAHLATMEKGKGLDEKVATMQTLFESLGQQLKPDEPLMFTPSFTPAHSYFKRILLHKQSCSNANVYIPEFMHTDHTLRSVEPYLCAKDLTKFFEHQQIVLKVASLACTQNCEYVGVFRVTQERKYVKELLMQTPDFSISEQEWLDGLNNDMVMDDLEFKQDLDHYEKQYMKHLQAVARKRREFDGDLTNPQPTQKADEAQAIEINTGTSDIFSLNSIDVFSELNMNPIENFILSEPRRNLNDTDLFAHVLDDDQEPAPVLSEVKRELSSANAFGAASNVLLLVQSNMDCWSLLGSIPALKEVHKKALVDKLPRSFYWLLETCAQTIGVDWSSVYEQLLVLELMFGYGIENLNEFKSCLRYKYNNPIKDINMLINLHRDIW